MTQQIVPANYTKLTWQQRRELREQYVVEQKGVCLVCKELLTNSPSEKISNHPINYRLFPVNMFKYPVHLHHDHDTGMTIGAVHSVCNAYLWQYEGK